MHYGFWLPLFGGWLRDIDDEQMPAGSPLHRGLTAMRRPATAVLLYAARP
jgi:hypothetical protein